MNCTNDAQQCPGIWKDIPGGVPPRGFLALTAPVDVLVVGKNPGHPFPNEPAELRGNLGPDLYVTHREMLLRYFAEVLAKKGRSTFHTNLFRYVSYFLDVPVSDIWTRAAFTNLVKCSTVGEQDRLAAKTMTECYRRYFERELEILQPRVLLALGREVEGYLRSHSGRYRDRVIYVKHPSYHYRKDVEAQELLAIKRALQQLL
jgi:hypothetical protein